MADNRANEIIEIVPLGGERFLRKTYKRVTSPALTKLYFIFGALMVGAVLVAVFVHPALGLGILNALIGALVLFRSRVEPFARGELLREEEFTVPYTRVESPRYQSIQTV